MDSLSCKSTGDLLALNYGRNNESKNNGAEMQDFARSVNNAIAIILSGQKLAEQLLHFSLQFLCFFARFFGEVFSV